MKTNIVTLFSICYLFQTLHASTFFACSPVRRARPVSFTKYTIVILGYLPSGLLSSQDRRPYHQPPQGRHTTRRHQEAHRRPQGHHLQVSLRVQDRISELLQLTPPPRSSCAASSPTSGTLTRGASSSTPTSPRSSYRPAPPRSSSTASSPAPGTSSRGSSSSTPTTPRSSYKPAPSSDSSLTPIGLGELLIRARANTTFTILASSLRAQVGI